MPSRHDIDHMDKHMAALYADYDGVDVNITEAVTLVRKYLAVAPVDSVDILEYLENLSNETRRVDPDARQRTLGTNLETNVQTIRGKSRITSQPDALRAIYEGEF